MAPRKEINGHQQTKNPRQAEAAADRKVFIKDCETACGCAKSETCEKVVVGGVLIIEVLLQGRRIACN
jgi:hypothetical protein